jgi:DNA-binding response OmpR family regulator
MRLLFIDDDVHLRSTLAEQLRREWFVVDTAKDGAEGSYLARTNEYDLIILDNMLPQKAGVLVCEEIREAKKNVPILVLSVLNESNQKVRLINAGADDYLSKPFSFNELMARIRALLRRPAVLEEDVLSVEDLTLNVRQQTLKHGKETIYLTRKEFMLFEYLLRNRGNVLSRSMIMEHVWDMNSDPFSNTIESHILSLRRKIGDKPSHRLIKTVPGRGYKIDVS